MRNLLIVLFALILMSIMLIGCGSGQKETVAKVGKFTISTDELKEAVGPMSNRWKTLDEAKEGAKGVLDNLVRQKLLILGAYKEGLDKDTTIVNRVKADDERRVLMALWEVEIAGKVKVSDQEVLDMYNKRNVEYNASHILVLDSTLAVELHNRIVGGEDFAALAQEHSKDPGSGARGGDLGWFTVGRMVKTFEDAVMALKDGEVSQPVKTRYGWHIIMRTGTRTREQEPFESVKENLKTQIEREKQQEASIAFVERVFENAALSLNDAAFNLIISKYSEAMKSEDPEQATIVSYSDDEKRMPLASWKGGSWTISDLDSVVNTMPPFRRMPFIEKEELENFIKSNLQTQFLLDEADRLGVEKSDKYKEMFTKSLEEAMLSTFQNEKIYNAIQINDDEIQAYYNANTDSFMDPKTIVVVECQLATEAEANDVLKKFKAGGDLAKLIEQKSLRTYTKNAGGRLEITEPRFPDLFASVNASKVGDVVGPIMDRTNRWSVMKVEEVREPTVMQFERVKSRIQSQLRRLKRDKAMEDFLASARKEFKVKINEKALLTAIDASRFTEAPKEAPAQPKP